MPGPCRRHPQRKKKAPQEASANIQHMFGDEAAARAAAGAAVGARHRVEGGHRGHLAGASSFRAAQLQVQVRVSFSPHIFELFLQWAERSTCHLVFFQFHCYPQKTLYSQQHFAHLLATRRIAISQIFIEYTPKKYLLSTK